MKSEAKAIALNKSITEGFDPIRHWAYVKAQLSSEYDRVLRANGFTSRTFHELETDAIAEMGREIDVVKTEFGEVSKLYTYVDDTDPSSARTIRGLKLVP